MRKKYKKREKCNMLHKPIDNQYQSVTFRVTLCNISVTYKKS